MIPSGSFIALLLCHPAWSIMSTKCSPGFRSQSRIFRNAFIVPALTLGASKAADSPVAGSTAAYR